ncbi:MAG TPA: CoA-binding protein [Chitinophagaceae bacterium]|nr:CoA-binding protein [Chitinophagaceae bacterium]
METPKSTLVLGASDNPARYSYLALQRLQQHGHPVRGIGKRPGRVGAVEILPQAPDYPGIHTVTVYLSPANQRAYYDYVIRLRPARVIFNPGAENPEFAALLTRNGIPYVDACTLVLLSTGQY